MRRDQRGPAAQKRLVDRLLRAGIVQQGPAHALDRFLARMLGIGVLPCDGEGRRAGIGQVISVGARQLECPIPRIEPISVTGLRIEVGGNRRTNSENQTPADKIESYRKTTFFSKPVGQTPSIIICLTGSS